MGQKNTPSTEGGQLRKSDPSLPSHLGIFPGEQKVLSSPNKELEENLIALEEHAKTLLKDESIPYSQRLIYLREHAKAKRIGVRDDELRRLLADARRQLSGAIESIGDRPLNLRPIPWLVDRIILPRCLNLLIAPPKWGKTSLMISLIGQWASGASTFIGQKLITPCPSVLIVGSDQPESDWGLMLKEVGLITNDNRLRTPPLVDLFTAGQPLQLDEEGIEKISTYAEDHPGLMVLIDSLAACIRNLGIDENSAEIDGPVRALTEALEPFEATLVLIHHSGKARIGDSPSLASRGSTALPACSSQIISLSRLTPPFPGSPIDQRIVLKTEGRSGKPLELLIERTESGWICHGDAEQVQAEKRRQTVEDKLHPQQKNALDLIRERWRTNQHWSNSKEIAAYLKLDGDSERKARETLDQLCRHGLAANKYLKKKNGRCKIYAPIEASREEVTPLSSKPSELSQLSEPNSQLHRRDRRERSLFPTVEPELIGSSFDVFDPDEDDPHWRTQ